MPLIVFALVLFAMQFLIMRAFPVCYVDGVYEVNVFLFALTVGIVFLSKFILKKMRNKQNFFGYVFLGSCLVKMAIIILFLIPVILGGKENKITYVIHFFVLYFAYLVMEVLIIVKQLKMTLQNKQEDRPVE